jgi:hypothetical protein
MLPMQMRAGVEYPHPHALFQLLLDASDDVIDHHTLVQTGEMGHDAHAHAAAASNAEMHDPDLPTYSDQIDVGANLAVLALLAALLTIPPAPTLGIWAQRPEWRGQIPALEPPPPRPSRC